MPETTTKTINKISSSWEPIGTMPTTYGINTYRMRKCQIQAFKTCFQEKFTILNGPTASGKTLMGCYILAPELANDKTKKAIFAVPQTIIADGFKGPYKLQYTDEQENTIHQHEIINWAPIHDLTVSTNAESNREYIKSFLSRAGQKGDINDRILLCSHASLVKAHQEYPGLFKNVIIFIDEAHHVQLSSSNPQELSFEENSNCLGKIIDYAINNEEANIGIMLSTATLFRGDKMEIIPVKHLSKFVKFWYPMDEFLEDCQYLSGFIYDFVMYHDQWEDALSEIFTKDGVRKTAIYIPSVGSKYYSYGSKEQDVDHIYAAIAGKKDYKKVELDNGMTLIERGKGFVKVVNLVDDSNMILRDKRKALIREAHNNSDSSLLDVIIALNMFKEGANWKWANRGVIIGTKGSLTDIQQMIGRFLRDAKDKKSVQILQLLPFSFDKLDKKKFRDKLNEYSKAILATMLIEDVICPAKIKLMVNRKDKSKTEGKDKKEEIVDYLRLYVQDDNQYMDICNEVREQAIASQVVDKVDFKKNTEENREVFRKIVRTVLSMNGIFEKQDEIAESIRRRWIRESIPKDKGVDLSEIDYDNIDINPLQFWLTYTSGMCGVKSLRDFHKVYAKTFYVDIAEWKKWCADNLKEYILAAMMVYHNSDKNKSGKELKLNGKYFHRAYVEWSHGRVKEWNGKDLPERPDDIPKNPQSIYRELRKDWED